MITCKYLICTPDEDTEDRWSCHKFRVYNLWTWNKIPGKFPLYNSLILYSYVPQPKKPLQKHFYSTFPCNLTPIRLLIL